MDVVETVMVDFKVIMARATSDRTSSGVRVPISDFGRGGKTGSTFRRLGPLNPTLPCVL